MVSHVLPGLSLVACMGMLVWGMEALSMQLSATYVVREIAIILGWHRFAAPHTFVCRRRSRNYIHQDREMHFSSLSSPQRQSVWYIRGISQVYDVKEETWSSTTFLILASISGVTLPAEISSRRGAWVAAKCARNSASHWVIFSTGIESRRPLTPA